jgi:hypothetical protein
VIDPHSRRGTVRREHEPVERLKREPRAYNTVVDGDETGSRQLVRIDWIERAGHGCDGQTLAGEEQPHEHRERLVGSGPEPECREPFVEPEAAAAADEPVDAVLVETGTFQTLAELPERLAACR